MSIARVAVHNSLIWGCARANKDFTRVYFKDSTRGDRILANTLHLGGADKTTNINVATDFALKQTIIP